MRWLVDCLFLVVATNISAQAPAPAHHESREVRVVRVQMGYVCGWCGGPGYRTNLTTVEPSFIVKEMGDAADPKKHPKRRERRAISKREWETLVRSIDGKALRALRALPQDNRCRPCADEPNSWIEIDFNDGSKLTVHYDWYPGKAPGPVNALKFPNLPIVFYEF